MNALLERPPLPGFVHGDPPTLVDQGFVIDDERKAAWACTKILAARHRMEVRQNLAEDYQTRILDWLGAANEPDQKSIEFLEASLRPWVEQALEDRGKSRSLQVFGARIGLRKRPDKVEISSPDETLAFCLEHLEEVVVVKRDLSKTELKKHLAAGARIPGAFLVPGTDELTVTSDGKGERHD